MRRSRSLPSAAARGTREAAGYFTGTVDFGGGPTTAVGKDAFVAMFNADGSYRWTKVFGGAQDQAALVVGMDGSSAVVTAGIKP